MFYNHYLQGNLKYINKYIQIINNHYNITIVYRYLSQSLLSQINNKSFQQSQIYLYLNKILFNRDKDFLFNCQKLLN